MTPLIIILCYLALLVSLGLASGWFFRGTSADYFVASRSIGPFLLLMSVFGTTMTAFALVGSTSKAFERGIGVYGLMASASGLVHAACFFLIGMRLWVYGKRYGYVTQIQFFRDRFESDRIGYLLFPILVALVVPYLLIGVMGAGLTVRPVTAGAFESLFPHPRFAGGIPPWLTGLVICCVVLVYVFIGGSRATAWANTFQTLVFMAMGLVAFILISNSLGGLENASKVTMKVTAEGKVVQPYGLNAETGKVARLEEPKVIGHVVGEGPGKDARPHLSRSLVTVAFHQGVDPETGQMRTFEREIGVPPLMFLTYLLIPLSVGMFPHVFQHWLTARSAKSFRLTVIAHPLCIMIVWTPCVLIGVWATGVLPPMEATGPVLGRIVDSLVASPVLTGLLTAGILAAIMSSLDSQFLCMGTIFTNDVVLHGDRVGKFSDRQIVWISRAFIIGIVLITYALAMVALAYEMHIFDLAVWCFSGFVSLIPLIIAGLYWRRATRAGAYACIVTAMGVWFYFFQAGGYGGEYTIWGGVMPVAVNLAASAAAMIIVSLFTEPPSRATIEKFFGIQEQAA